MSRLLLLSVPHLPAPSSLSRTTTMPEQAAQPAAAAKSKHSHAASQAAQPAPRKVRFNVGELLCLDILPVPHPPPKYNAS